MYVYLCRNCEFELSDYYLLTLLSVCYWTLTHTNFVIYSISVNVSASHQLNLGKYDVVILCAAVRLRRGAAMETAELFVSILWSGGWRLPGAWLPGRGEPRSCQRKFPKHRPSYLIATRLLDNVLLHITNDVLHHCHQPPDNIFLTVCTSFIE